MNNHLSKADLYSDAYKQQVANFNESKIKQRLESKFEVKPYYLANKNLYYFSCTCFDRSMCCWSIEAISYTWYS